LEREKYGHEKCLGVNLISWRVDYQTPASAHEMCSDETYSAIQVQLCGYTIHVGLRLVHEFEVLNACICRTDYNTVDK